jgi:hypothetical protein
LGSHFHQGFYIENRTKNEILISDVAGPSSVFEGYVLPSKTYTRGEYSDEQLTEPNQIFSHTIKITAKEGGAEICTITGALYASYMAYQRVANSNPGKCSTMAHPSYSSYYEYDVLVNQV